MSSNVGKKCFQLWCVLCAVQFVTNCTAHSKVYSLHPYFRAESFKHLFYKKCALLSVYSQIKQTHWCFDFRYVPCNTYEYWKVGKSRIEISTMKLRIADIMTQDVGVNDLRFLTLKIYSA
jgi:hypothetical protein